MNELEKYQAVNNCETLEQLAEVILSFADEDGNIQGRSRKFSASEMASACLEYDLAYHNSLTREYGIRQQAMYIIFYNK
jgi:hypothetical protein